LYFSVPSLTYVFFPPEFHIAVVLLVIGQSGRVFCFVFLSKETIHFVDHVPFGALYFTLLSATNILLGGCMRDFVISDIKQI